MFKNSQNFKKQREFILAELQNGRVFTNRDMQQTESISNPWSCVSELRKLGHKISKTKFQSAAMSTPVALYFMPGAEVPKYYHYTRSILGIEMTTSYTEEELTSGKTIRVESPFAHWGRLIPWKK